MAKNKIERIDQEIAKTREKIAEQQEKLKALVYFKFIKQKPKTKGSDNLDDYDYGEEEELPEDETWETEPEDADGGGDEESENPAK